MIDLMYRSFGRNTPPDLHGPKRFFAWILAFSFVVTSLILLGVFNFFSLFFGLYVNFLGREGVRYRFLLLFRRVPIIGFAPLILLAYAIRQNLRIHTVWEIIMMPALTIGLAVFAIFAIAGVNTARRRDGGR